MKKTVFALVAAMAMGGCSTLDPFQAKADPALNKALQEQKESLSEKRQQAEVDQVRKALQEMTPTPVAPKAQERRFNLAAKELSAQATYQAIADNANYNVILSPEVSEKITINLKDVTVQEALESLREAYGLEFDINGRRLMVSKAKVQNRTFQVDYLLGSRSGKSEVRVSSGSVADGAGAQSGGQNNGVTGGNQAGSGGRGGSQEDGSKITTTIQNDFWQTLEAVLKGIVSGKDGQEIVINPQSGLVFVKAWPSQLREVEKYLELTQNKVARQVVLEAKIVQVTLSSGAQAGINWSSFDSKGNHKYSVGANSGAIYPQGGGFVAPTALGGAAGLLNSASSLATSGAGGLGLAFTGTNFAALMSFLQTQGETQVLSAIKKRC